MLPNPIHPAVVHFPIAFAFLVPIAGFAVLVALRRGVLPRRAWAAIVLLQTLLAGTAWLAVETGEREEETVERVVAERFIEDHEERAEQFRLAAGIGLLIIGVGLLPGPVGGAGRVAGVLASLVVLETAVAVGHSGGELVHKHGAATAYVQPNDGVRGQPQAARGDDD